MVIAALSKKLSLIPDELRLREWGLALGIFLRFFWDFLGVFVDFGGRIGGSGFFVGVPADFRVIVCWGCLTKVVDGSGVAPALPSRPRL